MQVRQRCLLVGRGCSWWCYGKKHEIRERVALAVVIKKEERPIANDWPADISPELVEMIGLLGATLSFDDAVGAGFRDHVDHRPTRVPEFRGIGVRIHLKFLHRVFAELVGRAARPRPAIGLPEERVVVVRSIHDEGIESAALARKADVPATNVECDAGREERKVDEIASIRREVLNRNIIYRGAHLAASGFDDRGFARHRH